MPSIQFDEPVRNAIMEAYETAVGTSPKLRLFTGPIPANCAAASTGTMLCEIALPADWASASVAGTKAKLGTWSGTTVAAGVCGYYRLFNTAGTLCREQGTVTQAITLITSAATAAGSNILTFASVVGVVSGQGVAGIGVPPGTTVISAPPPSVLMNAASVTGVTLGASISFGDTTGNLLLNNTTFSVTQGVTIDTKSITCPGA